jgi:hypothetical protein
LSELDKNGFMTKATMMKRVRSLIQSNHPDIRGLFVSIMTDQERPSNWSCTSNKWSVKTYPTGFKQKQVYVMIRAANYPATIFDVSDDKQGIMMKMFWRSSV